MEQRELHEIEARCTQEEMPRCQAACPLHLDVRAFMAKMAEGDAKGGRTVLERLMPLPSLLARICDHPCENVCLRDTLGGSLHISLLERACVVQCPTPGRTLPRPPKKKRFAVLGDGLAGLVAAWDLGRKGYPVTVFCAGTAGDALRPLCVDAPTADALQTELETLRGHNVTFEEQTPLTPELLRRAEADGVFVDVSCAPSLCPDREQVDMLTRAIGRKHGLCFGGGATLLAENAAEGRRAATTLERHVNGASITAQRERELQRGSRLFTPLEGVTPLEAIAAPPDGYDAPAARAEAERCLRCQCLACVQHCAYLQEFKGYPKSYARQIYNNAAIVKGVHLANRMINACSLCGRCTELCPDNFSMADLCLGFRQDMVERRYMPPSAHEFALEDMEAANGPDCAAALPDPATDACAHAFFPGCQLAAARGEQVMAVFAHLRRRLVGGVGLMLRCCGVPAHWAGREADFQKTLRRLREDWETLGRTRLVVACASCRKTLREHAPEIPADSLWEVLRDAAPAPRRDLPSCELVVHDPCAARHDAGWQEAVRALAERQGVTLREPPLTRGLTACCGYGGLVSTARPDTARRMAEQRGAELRGEALASCIMCRDRLAASGTPARHLLDLLFPVPGTRPEAPGPGLSARRAGRAALRRRVLSELYGRTVESPAPALRVHIPDATLERMEVRHILRQDVERAVEAVERAGSRLRDKASGHFLGAFRPARVTFWVRYASEGGEITVHDAWCHRMIVPGAGEDSGESDA